MMQKMARLNLLNVSAAAFMMFAAGAALSAQDGAAAKSIALEEKKAKDTVNPEDAAASLKELYGKEKVSREVTEETADAYVSKAVKYYQQNDYKNCIDNYNEALKVLRNLSDSGGTERINGKIENCKLGISKSYYYWSQQIYFEAEKAANLGDFQSAIDKCNLAMEVNPGSKAKMEEAIAKYSQMKKAAEYRSQLSEKVVDPTKEERLYSIEVLMKQGEVLYKDKQWDKARSKFEEVISINPYHTGAIDYMRKIHLAMMKAGELRTQVTDNERKAESLWKSITPIVLNKSSEGRDVADAAIAREDTESELGKKLKGIIIDHIEFEEVEIASVARYLKQQSKLKDPDKIGVNIVLRGSINGGAVKEGEEAPEPRLITMVVDNISLDEAIRYICKAANLKYRVEKYAVIIATPDVQLDDVETKIYPIEKDALDIYAVGSTSEAVQASFEKRGVSFPTGAKIVYDDFSSRLIATNTHDNMQKIENIIKELNVVDPQVLIQTKFVEVNMNDLQELGFEYTVSRQSTNVRNRNINDGDLVELTPGTSYEMPYNALVYMWTPANVPSNTNIVVKPATNWSNLASINQNGTVTTVVSQGDILTVPVVANDTTKYYYAKAPIQGSSTSFGPNSKLVRNVKDDYTAFGASTSINDTVANWSHFNKYGYSVDASVHAVDLADSSEMLACPRVTTMNGQPAKINMIREVYYPESWSEADIATMTSGNGANAATVPIITPSIPEFGDVTEEGIMLSVTPEVDADNYTITLQMNPVIQKMVGWIDYSYDINLESGNVIIPFTNTLKMPIIERRTVETKVSCYDGETVILGGMISDNAAMVDDQYPILGDIPLIGRLFQSKGQSSQKKNLLIFLSCRLVNPDGSPLREREDRGLPPFKD